jgi:hypothetical protein
MGTDPINSQSRRDEIIIANQMIENEPRRGESIIEGENIIDPKGRHDCRKHNIVNLSPEGVT